jgi:hypothetical protein
VLAARIAKGITDIVDKPRNCGLHMLGAWISPINLRPVTLWVLHDL